MKGKVVKKVLVKTLVCSLKFSLKTFDKKKLTKLEAVRSGQPQQDVHSSRIPLSHGEKSVPFINFSKIFFLLIIV